ncbi:MAG TPA: hypothetical protein VFZ59_01035 [Verrucomicrobiae bacterium]|nr:hypothetical protein [Verrucomicrobiae bacterium]
MKAGVRGTLLGRLMSGIRHNDSIVGAGPKRFCMENRQRGDYPFRVIGGVRAKR